MKKTLILVMTLITIMLLIVACAPTVQAPGIPIDTQSSTSEETTQKSPESTQTSITEGDTTKGDASTSPSQPEKEETKPEATTPHEPTQSETKPVEPEETKPKETKPTEPKQNETHPTNPKPTNPPHEHKYTSHKTDATCEKDGQTVYTCSCGDKYTESIPKVGHSYTSERVEPTCDAYGTITYTCTRCNHSYTENIAMKDHQYKLTKTVESTVSKKGYQEYTCGNCGKTYKEELPLKKGAMDTDKCGDSLIWKPLKHAGYVNFMTQAFRCLNDRITDTDQSYCVETPDDTNFYSWFTDTYRYIAEPFYYTFYRYDDKPDLFLMWGKDSSVYAQQDAVYAEAKRVIKQLGIAASTTQREAIAKINNYICEQKYYQYDESKRDGSTYHSIFGDNGVCHNYSVAFQVLCLTAGIECHYYSSNTMNHAWNKVYFSDGSYYWVDVTWNDSATPNQYLLITTEQLLKDHTL